MVGVGKGRVGGQNVLGISSSSSVGTDGVGRGGEKERGTNLYSVSATS